MLKGGTTNTCMCVYVYFSRTGNVGVTKDEFIHSVLSVMETVMQHPSLIASYQQTMTSEIAVSLSQLCLSEHGNAYHCIQY